jgi:hypothetical protein
MLMVRCLSGDEIEPTDRVIPARRELELAGLLEGDSTRPTRAARRRRRSSCPMMGRCRGPLSPGSATTCCARWREATQQTMLMAYATDNDHTIKQMHRLSS